MANDPDQTAPANGEYYIQALIKLLLQMENTIDPDQTAPANGE